MSNWNLRRQRIACTVCDASFADRARYFSVLTTESGELRRSDYCTGCWAARTNATADVFWWRTRHTERKQRGLSFNVEALEALFVALEGRNDLPVQELRYLLCLLLMRKRRLKIVRMTRAAAADALIGRRPRREEEFVVFAHEFSPERMAELRVELRALFAGGAAPIELSADISP